MSTLKGNIKFTGHNQQEFFAALRQRVDAYFTTKGISRHANAQMVIKSLLFLSFYFVPYFILMLMQVPVWEQILLWFVMGLSLAGIGMSVMHDANHGAYSSRKWVNTMMGHTLNIVGGSVFNWKHQHNILHHTYTNISSYDEDIDDKLILRMSPHTKVKGIHRFQIVYAFLFYGILTLYWALAKDFIQFSRHVKNGVNPQSKSQNAITLSKIIITKLFYFGYSIIIPLAVFHVDAYAWMLGFLFMHLTAGMILTVIFQLAHTVEGTQHPLPSPEGTIENSWAVHQLCTTVNFATHNKWLSYYVGGLNFQVEHHLFPRICHVHYPAIAPIIEATAREYGIPYMENKRFVDAVASHIRTLRRFGKATLELG